MKLPPNFARTFVKGGARDKAAEGWAVRIGNKSLFVTRLLCRHPGAVRKRIEKVLGIRPPPPSDEEQLVTKIRLRATRQRHGKNLAAAGLLPGRQFGRRSLRAIKQEERVLNIANRFQQMGEYRK